MNAPVQTFLPVDFYKAAQSRDPEDMARYMMIERTPLVPADLIVGFGNVHISQQIAGKCLDLYEKGLAPRILLTGGKPHGDGRSEAAYMAGILRERGVPDDVVFCEGESLNTQENVQKSRALITSLAPAFSPRSAIAVGHIVAGRRFLMTLAQNWPELTTLMADNVWPPGTTCENWRAKPNFVAELAAQFDRIAPYFANGFITEIEIGRGVVPAPTERRAPCL